VGIRGQVLRVRNTDVATVDIGVSGDTRLVFHDIGKIQQAFFKNLILRIEQPLFTLRVVG